MRLISDVAFLAKRIIFYCATIIVIIFDEIRKRQTHERSIKCVYEIFSTKILESNLPFTTETKRSIMESR